MRPYHFLRASDLVKVILIEIHETPSPFPRFIMSNREIIRKASSLFLYEKELNLCLNPCLQVKSDYLMELLVLK